MLLTTIKTVFNMVCYVRKLAMKSTVYEFHTVYIKYYNMQKNNMRDHANVSSSSVDIAD